MLCDRPPSGVGERRHAEICKLAPFELGGPFNESLRRFIDPKSKPLFPKPPIALCCRGHSHLQLHMYVNRTNFSRSLAPPTITSAYFADPCRPIENCRLSRRSSVRARQSRPNAEHVLQRSGRADRVTGSAMKGRPRACVPTRRRRPSRRNAVGLPCATAALSASESGHSRFFAGRPHEVENAWL